MRVCVCVCVCGMCECVMEGVRRKACGALATCTVPASQSHTRHTTMYKAVPLTCSQFLANLGLQVRVVGLEGAGEGAATAPWAAALKDMQVGGVFSFSAHTALKAVVIGDTVCVLERVGRGLEP